MPLERGNLLRCGLKSPRQSDGTGAHLIRIKRRIVYIRYGARRNVVAIQYIKIGASPEEAT